MLNSWKWHKYLLYEVGPHFEKNHKKTFKYFQIFENKKKLALKPGTVFNKTEVSYESIKQNDGLLGCIVDISLQCFQLNTLNIPKAMVSQLEVFQHVYINSTLTATDFIDKKVSPLQSSQFIN